MRLRRRPAQPVRPRHERARRSRAAGFAILGASLVAATGAVALLVVNAPSLLARLPYFRVETVEVTGLSYLTREEVLAAAGIDPSTSVWEPEARFANRMEAHPLVRSATVTRELPSTLRLAIREAAPVGLVASPLVIAVDHRGNKLPIDPTEPVLDLPVLRVLTPLAAASWGIRLLARDVGRMAELAPEVFAVVSEARLDDHQVTLFLGDPGVRVRYLPPVSAVRLREAMIAINDAVERFPDSGPREIDLRFADQVVVRTEGGGG